jgi:hypothetical protein
MTPYLLLSIDCRCLQAQLCPIALPSYCHNDALQLTTPANTHAMHVAATTSTAEPDHNRTAGTAMHRRHNLLLLRGRRGLPGLNPKPLTQTRLHTLTLLTMASTVSGDALLLGIGMITTCNTPSPQMNVLARDDHNPQHTILHHTISKISQPPHDYNLGGMHTVRTLQVGGNKHSRGRTQPVQHHRRVPTRQTHYRPCMLGCQGPLSNTGAHIPVWVPHVGAAPAPCHPHES